MNDKPPRFVPIAVEPPRLPRWLVLSIAGWLVLALAAGWLVGR